MEEEIRKAFKQGRSLVVTIPSNFVDELDIEDGQPLSIDLENDEIMIRMERKTGDAESE